MNMVRKTPCARAATGGETLPAASPAFAAKSRAQRWLSILSMPKLQEREQLELSELEGNRAAVNPKPCWARRWRSFRAQAKARLDSSCGATDLPRGLHCFGLRNNTTRSAHGTSREGGSLRRAASSSGRSRCANPWIRRSGQVDPAEPTALRHRERVFVAVSKATPYSQLPSNSGLVIDCALRTRTKKVV